jgi:hypothetical protein
MRLIGMKGLEMGRVGVFMVGRLVKGVGALELTQEVIHLDREGF